MPPEALEYDSDSESESGSDYSVTQTQLGVSDGPLENQDIANPLVSRMGGQVAWLPSKVIPPSSISVCTHCSQQMELLVQIFAPLDESPYDRLLLVWGCARGRCQKKRGGSVRAIRLLTFNERWAVKLEKKKQRQQAKEARQQELQKKRAAREEEEESKRKVNPFTASASKGEGLGGALFGGSANPFAVRSVNAPDDKAKEDSLTSTKSDSNEAKELVGDEEDSESEDDQLAEEMAIKASLETSRRPEADWAKAAPAYQPAQYLNTYAEPSSSARAYDEAKESKKELKKLKESGGIGEMKGWEAEKYESMMVSGIDETFERFVKRVSPNGKQVVRYEFGGTPLPFHATGPAYELLWPKQKASSTTISRAAFADQSRGSSRDYSTEGISSCPLCGSKRVFEVQLMPNLVNTLRPNEIVGGQEGEGEEEKDAEKKKKREIEEAIGHALPDQPDADGITRSKPSSTLRENDDSNRLARRTGLQWSTAMVFVCGKDCRGEDQGEIWSEEVVEIQLEHEK